MSDKVCEICQCPAPWHSEGCSGLTDELRIENDAQQKIIEVVEQEIRADQERQQRDKTKWHRNNWHNNWVKNTKGLACRVDHETYEEIAAYAKTKNCSVAEAIRQLIELGMQDVIIEEGYARWMSSSKKEN